MWKDFKLYIKFFNRQCYSDFLLLLQVVSVTCVFQKMWPFHLSCHLGGRGVNISSLPFNVYRIYSDVLYFILDNFFSIFSIICLNISLLMSLIFLKQLPFCFFDFHYFLFSVFLDFCCLLFSSLYLGLIWSYFSSFLRIMLRPLIWDIFSCNQLSL